MLFVAIRESLNRFGWWVHLVVLAAYPVVLGLLGQQESRESGRALLPSGIDELLIVAGLELGVFAIIFGFAWIASRASLDQLMLRVRSWWLALLRGFGYSIVLRILVMIFVIVASAVLIAFAGGDQSAAQVMQPQVSRMVDLDALTGSDTYFWLSVTVISFLVAGFREELWRAGVIAGLRKLFPAVFSGKGGGFLAAGLAAVVFGLGHLPQGWGGVAVVTVLGWGLGAVMVLHDSVWDAVIAHGFFNAASFAALRYLSENFPEMLDPVQAVLHLPTIF